MYKIKDYEADCIAYISLTCDERDDLYTKWEIWDSDLSIIEREFENSPTKEEALEEVTKLFRNYVEGIVGNYPIEEINMGVYDGEGNFENEDGVNLKEVYKNKIDWGKLTKLDIDFYGYEIEEIKE